LLGLEVLVHLDHIQDDLYNTEPDINHPQNPVKEQSLDVAKHIMTHPTENLYMEGRWDDHAVDRYFSQMESLKEMIMDLFVTACGPMPRISELSSVECENGPSSPRGSSYGMGL